MNACARLKKAGLLESAMDPKNKRANLLKSAADSAKLFGFTAYLHVNYRCPVFLAAHGGKEKSKVLVLRAQEKEALKGRKVLLGAQLTDVDGSRLYADAEALYMLPRPQK